MVRREIMNKEEKESEKRGVKRPDRRAKKPAPERRYWVGLGKEPIGVGKVGASEGIKAAYNISNAWWNVRFHTRSKSEKGIPWFVNTVSPTDRNGMGIPTAGDYPFKIVCRLQIGSKWNQRVLNYSVRASTVASGETENCH
jgi:hypothetical protein